MDLQLSSRRALVTGGTRGIGRAIVEGFAAEGAAVGFCARSVDDVAAMEQPLKDRGVQVLGQALDVADGARCWLELRALHSLAGRYPDQALRANSGNSSRPFHRVTISLRSGRQPAFSTSPTERERFGNAGARILGSIDQKSTP